MLIVEQLHLLLTREDGSDERGVHARRAAEAAALIADLMVAGRVRLSDEQPVCVRICSREPRGNAVLDRGLAWLEKKDGARLDAVVSWSKLDPTDGVVDALIETGTLTLGRRRLIVGPRRTPQADPVPEQHVRARLAAVLQGEAAPAFADVALLAILRGLAVARHILRAEDGERLQAGLRRKADLLIAASPDGTALEHAVREASVTMSTVSVVPAAVVTDAGAS